MTTTPDFFKRLTGLRFCRPANPLSVDGEELTGTILSEPFDNNERLGAPAWFVWALTDDGETRTVAVNGLVFSADACDVLAGAVDGGGDGDGGEPSTGKPGTIPGPERYGDMELQSVEVSPAYLHGLEALALWLQGPEQIEVILDSLGADSQSTMSGALQRFCQRYNLTAATITPKDGYND